MILKNCKQLTLLKHLRNSNKNKVMQKDIVNIFSIQQQSLFDINNRFKFSVLKREAKQGKQYTKQQKLNFQINMAKTSAEINKIFQTNKYSMDYINRGILLNKLTRGQHEYNNEVFNKLLIQIQKNWQQDFQPITPKNSKSIANTIAYLSRKKKAFNLQNQICSLNYNELAKWVNQKQFIMTINGLLKLSLLKKIQKVNENFKLQNLIYNKLDQKYQSSLIISLWFNLVKAKQSSKKFNDFFSELIKNREFKDNLIDYMELVYCVVNTEGQRTVDLDYPLMNYPTQLKHKDFIKAHQLSVLYKQLANLKKIKNIFFSNQFHQLLGASYFQVIDDSHQLRNLANVFNNLIDYQTPSQRVLINTFQKYYTILQKEISFIQKSGYNRTKKPNVDPLSFVSLFTHFIKFKDLVTPQNNYSTNLIDISLDYLQNVMAHDELAKEYNTDQVLGLLNAIDLTKKLIQQENKEQTLVLPQHFIANIEKQIFEKRDFTKQLDIYTLLNFATNFSLRRKIVCKKLSKLLQNLQGNSVLKQRLEQKCLMSKTGLKCAKCFDI